MNHQHFFEQVYNHLNAKQTLAVNQIEGPVMVVAGPGTGKTQILAARIANILIKTDSVPNNILCLTFTEAGAVAMRKRLTTFIGPDAYKIHIHTFHSFCNYVIQQNKDVFEYIDWQPVSDLEKHEIMREIINALPIEHPLRRAKGEIYYDIRHLLSLFDLMKKEDLSTVKLDGLIQSHLDELPFDEKYIYKRKSGTNNKGDLKQKDIDKVTKKLDKLSHAIHMYTIYNDSLKAKQRYDFNDMILWVLEMFKNNPDVLYKYQEQFLYLLVDEFQDTNAAQYNIVKQLASFWDAPNLFVVGDDDQTIYRFQGADMGNILNFNDQYSNDIKTVVLEENYRSSQSILDAASGLIKHNRNRLVNANPTLTKKLTSSVDLPIKTAIPSIKVFKNKYAETVSIAQDIENKIKQGIDPNDIAIIYKKHKHAEELLSYFNKKAIPYNLVKKINAFDIEIIEQLIKVLTYVDHEKDFPFSGDGLLFEILHYNQFDIPVLLLATLSREATKNKTSIREEANLLVSKSTEKKSDIKAIESALAFTDNCIRLYFTKTPADLLEYILIEGGFFNYLYHQNNRKLSLEAVTTLFNFLKEEIERKSGLTLSHFLQTLSEMKTYGIELPLNFVFSNSSGINLMSAHGSKGLEFKHVYIINCSLNEWDKDRAQNVYDLKEIFPELEDEGVIEDNRRLFYVAITRAKESLTLSYHLADNKGKESTPSQYIVEILENDQIDIENVDVDENATTDFVMHFAPSAELPQISLIDKSILEEVLQNYSLSVTHLNTYLHCPISFYFKHILRIPAAKNYNMALGSAMHGTLEKIFIEFNKSTTFPTVPLLLNWYEYQLNRQRTSFTQEEFDRFLAYGKLILPGYLESRQSNWKAPKYETEVRINTNYNHVPINGMLDNVAIYGNEVVVTDFKTGKHEKSKYKLAAPNSGSRSHTFELEHGGDYWRQIMFYKILIDNDPMHHWKMTRGIIDFIEPLDDEFFLEQIAITAEGVNQVKAQISTTYDNILLHKFDTGCGLEECEWCVFAKKYYNQS